jgi:hypothetical protein
MTLYAYKVSKILPIIYDELIKVIPTIKPQLPTRIEIANLITDKDLKAMFDRIFLLFKQYGFDSDFYYEYLEPMTITATT